MLLARDISFLPYGNLYRITCNMAASFFQTEGSGREKEGEKKKKQPKQRHIIVKPNLENYF